MLPILDQDNVRDSLAAEIKTRHYSGKTLKAYADWTRKFQGFLKDKPPAELSTTDKTCYLTHVSPLLCHTSFASQLRYPHDPGPTGHSDIRTTMIYTHCVPSKTIKELKSPLDFEVRTRK